MTLDEELRLSYYRRMSPLNAAHEVWLVQHTETGRVFVQKKLSNYSLAVFRELMAHPVEGVPRVFEAVEDGGSLIVIEQYIDGSTVAETMEKRGPFSEEDTLRIAIKLAAILERLHSLTPPVIHRDIKPSNVILSEGGAVTLIDLDAAKLQNTESARDTELLGTAGYAAPEQYGFGSSGPQTDIYALGVLMNDMVTGALPQEKLAEGRLGRVIKKCVDIDPKRRYPSAKELEYALSRAAAKSLRGGEDMPDPVEDAPRFSKYRPLGFRTLTPWKMILALIGYIIIGIVCFLTENGPLRQPWKTVFRAGQFLMFVILILLPSNFCGILDILGVNKIKSKVGRIIVIVLFELVLAVLMIIGLMSLPMH